ncbi:MAG: class I SAM-dependent methyltransferase [Planctomycetota bacterium]
MHRWPRGARVLDLFCGSGAGLVALERLGFTDVIGVDHSALLLATYTGRFPCVHADCRDLTPIESGSADLVVIQGGLHHLDRLDEDLSQVLSESWRVLREAGALALLEPWGSPFLSFAHAVAARPWARRLSRAVDAFGTMVDEEGETYRTWLAEPGLILRTIDTWFETTWSSVAWGKRTSLGLRRPRPLARSPR